jgi:hypothetical protein
MQAPRADITAGGDVQRRWYWKAYFVLAASMVVLVIGFYLYPGRFGYEKLWQLVFGVTVLETAWTAYSFGNDLPDLQGFEAGFLAVMAVVGTALMAPMLAALFIYAFRSPRLWADANLA